MLTLVIDSATEACSVALFDNDRLVAGEWRMLGRGHAELLVPMIAALPANGRADRIAVSLGPGSFTGVRVGLAAGRALTLAWGSELLGFPTLDLIAAMAREKRGDVPVTVAMTGGHGEWFVQGFAANGSTATPLASLPPTAAAKAEDALIAGSQADALVAARGSGESLAIWPDARSFKLLSKSVLRDEIQPLYGRPPDARLPGATA